MDYTFYEIAVKIVGSVPDTLLWVYDLTTIFLVIVAVCIFIIPTSIMFKKVVGG